MTVRKQRFLFLDNVLPAELSLFEMYPSLQFNRLNKYQTDAVKEALRKPFTLIQGPPGKNLVYGYSKTTGYKDLD